MPPIHPPRDARLGRLAVAVMFFVNGFIIGSWAPQIPVVLTRFAITETTLGLLIVVFGLGAMIAMPLAGVAMSHFSSRAVLRASALAATTGLLLVALAPDAWTATPALFLFGGALGTMDVAMNTNAVAVERRLGHPIMSSSHGFWSLGGFAGGGLGGLVILEYGHIGHAIGVTAATLLLVAAVLRFILVEERPVATGGGGRAFPTDPAVYLVGVIALFSMVPEGAVLDWAALYLKQALGADIATAGFAFAAFSGAMAIMRFAGDAVRARLGAVTTLRISALVAAGGMLAGGTASDPWLAVLAFAAAGIGIANTVPIAFSAAGNQPGMTSSTGMSVVTTMGYSGILLAPSAIGFVGERTGFGPVFVAMAGLLVAVALMAGLARSAERAHQPAA